jgi:hypothetical protein
VGHPKRVLIFWGKVRARFFSAQENAPQSHRFFLVDFLSQIVIYHAESVMVFDLF